MPFLSSFRASLVEMRGRELVLFSRYVGIRNVCVFTVGRHPFEPELVRKVLMRDAFPHARVISFSSVMELTAAMSLNGETVATIIEREAAFSTPRGVTYYEGPSSV
jgi:hypothetical protein